METRANYALIGLFTLVVVAGAFLFVYWFAAAETGRPRTDLQIVFAGSVSGLSRGSAVNFNGIRVGEVTELQISPENPGNVLARIAVDPATPLRADTTARLEYQGLTGIATVSLSGGTASAPQLTGAEGLPPTIVAEPSDFQDLIESARNIARRASDVFDRFDELLAANGDAVGETVQNVRTFSQALAENAPAIDRFLEQVGAAAERIGPLADSLDGLATNLNAVVASLDAESVNRSIRNVEGFTQGLADSRDEIERAAADAAALMARLVETAGSVEATVADVRALVGGVDAAAIGETVENLRDFSQTLAGSREDLSRIAQNAAALTQRLTESAGRLDATLANVEGVSQTFADNRENIARTLEQAAALTTRLNETSVTLDAALSDVGAVVAAIDPARVEATVDAVEAFSRTLADNREAVGRIVADAQTLTRNLAGTSERIDAAVSRVDGIVAAVDPAAVSATLENARAFSQTLADNREAVTQAVEEVRRIASAIDSERIARVVENVDRFAATLGANAESIDAVVANAVSISGKLDAAADRLDGVLAAAEGFLGDSGAAGEGLFDEVREAAAALRTLATNLDQRTAQLSDNLNRFTGPGLQEYRALAAEGRRTLEDISRAVRGLERDPSRIIFGGGGGSGGVQEYQGRR